MKAWIVSDPVEGYSAVVFAESRGKARVAALCTEECMDSDFLEIKPRRFPEADCMYRGDNWRMDWFNDEDRRFLLQHGWHCEREYADCAECEDLQYCEWGQDLLREGNENESCS